MSTKFIAADLREGISATNSLPQFVGKKFGVPNSFPLFGEKEFPPVDASAQVRGNEFPLVPKPCRTSICEFSKKTRKQRIALRQFPSVFFNVRSRLFFRAGGFE